MVKPWKLAFLPSWQKAYYITDIFYCALDLIFALSFAPGKKNSGLARKQNIRDLIYYFRLLFFVYLCCCVLSVHF